MQKVEDVNTILLNGASELRAFYQELRSAKSFDASIPTVDGYEYLLSQKILRESDQRISLNYSLPTCIVFSHVILDESFSNVPGSLEEIVDYSRNIIRIANQHGVNAATSVFKAHLMKEMVIQNFISGNDLTARILALQKSAHIVYKCADPIAMAIPELPLSLEVRYRLHSHLYAQVYDQGGGYAHIFESLQEMAKTFGTDFLDIVLANKNKMQGYVMNTILGLYSKDKKEAWTAIETIDRHEYEVEIINAIGNFKFESEEDYKGAIAYLDETRPKDINSVSLAWAFSNIINSQVATQEIKSKYITALEAITSSHQNAQGSVINIVERLNVEEDVKHNILEKLNLKNADLHGALGWALEKFSPTLCFAILRRIAIATKLDFNAESFEYSLESLSKREPEAFSGALIRLLTDDLGIARFAGNRVLQQINSKHHPFVFQSDVLQLRDDLQIRFISAVLLDFMHAENVIKFILPFRNSSHTSVLQFLVDNIAAIVEDYPSDTLKVLKSQLNPEIETDKQLINIFEKYTADLSELITKKNKIEEFNPNNRALEVSYFERLVNDKMRKQLNVAHDKDPLFNVVHKVSIARGKAWKIDKHDSEPSLLSLVSTAITFPRVCLMNPDEYNWRIIVQINTNYRNNG